jgi:hypothetical protein
MDHIENDTSNNSSIIACNRCHSVFTEQLPSSNTGFTYTDWWEGFMMYAIEMGSGTMIYTSNLMNWFGHCKTFIGGYPENMVIA